MSTTEHHTVIGSGNRTTCDSDTGSTAGAAVLVDMRRITTAVNIAINHGVALLYKDHGGSFDVGFVTAAVHVATDCGHGSFTICHITHGDRRGACDNCC